MVWAKYNCGLSFWQRNNDVTRKHLTHKNTSLSNAVYSNAQQCKNILKNFVVNEKQRKYNCRKNHTTFAKKHARASPLPHHTSISATSERYFKLK
jgi:hypothetical protein